MSVKFDQEIDRYMARQAAHKPHDSCRGPSDPDYHEEADYMDKPTEATSDPPEQEAADVA